MIGGDEMDYEIRYTTSNPSKVFQVNELEVKFFDNLSCLLSPYQNEHIDLVRMSDGTIAVSYHSYPIGKVKLQGRKHSMQILKGSYGVTSLSGNVDDFIEQTPKWVSYLKKL